MKKTNKLFAITAILMFLLSTRCISISASIIADIDEVGTSLMTALLDRQYASFVNNSVCNTSDIMSDTESNEFYNYFLKWYSGSSAALGESWTKYEYALSLTETNGNTLKFSNTVRYWVENCGFEWVNSDIEYEITIGKTGADYYITAISTTAGDYNDFKRLIEGKASQQSANKNPETQTMSDYVNELISDSQKLNAAAESMRSNGEDVVHTEQLHQDSLKYVISPNDTISGNAIIDFISHCIRTACSSCGVSF